jgi:Na+-transporting NADH:ubiquinone oxidoreductase subunit NqrC
LQEKISLKIKLKKQADFFARSIEAQSLNLSGKWRTTHRILCFNGSGLWTGMHTFIAKDFVVKIDAATQR